MLSKLKEDLVKKQEEFQKKIDEKEEESESESSYSESSHSAKSSVHPKVNPQQKAEDTNWNNYVDPFKAKYDEKLKEVKDYKEQQKQTNSAIKDLMLSFEQKLKDS